MPDNSQILNTEPANTTPDLSFTQGYRPQLTPFQQSSSLLNIYRPLNLTAGSNIQDNNKSITDIFSRADNYQNLPGNSNDITTALPATDRYNDPNLGYSSFRNNEDFYAQWHKQNDSFLNNHFNPLSGAGGPLSVGFYAGLAGKIVGKFGDGIGNLFSLMEYGVHGLGESTGLVKDDDINSFGEWITNGGDTVLNKVFGGLDRFVDKTQMTYQEASDENKGLFNKLFTDGDFWNTSIKDGVAFLGSAIIPGAILGKLGVGAKLAGYLGKTATAMEAEGAASSVIGEGGALSTNGTNLFLRLGMNQARLATTLDYATNLVYNVPMEASMEAKGVGVTVYDSLWGKINPETGNLYTEEEKTKISGAAASQVYRQNLAVLALSNALELRATFKALGIGNKALKAEVSGLGLLDKSEALRGGFKSLAKGIGKEAAIGTLSEGFYEENIQYAIQKTAEDTYSANGAYGNIGANAADNNNKLFSVNPETWKMIKKYASQTGNLITNNSNNKELNESVFIGALLGVAGGSVAGVNEHRSENLTNIKAAIDLNSTKSSFLSMDNPYETETNEITDDKGNKSVRTVIKTDEQGQPILSKDIAKGYSSHLAYMENLNNIINNTNDGSSQSELAKNASFMNVAGEYAKYGLMDKFVASLDKIKTANTEDLKVLMPSLDFDKEDVMKTLPNKVEQLKNIALEMESAYEFIDKNIVPISSRKRDQEDAALRKHYLMNQAKQNLSLKLYDRKITDENLNLKSKLDQAKQSSQTIEDLTNPDIIQLNSDINSVNDANTKRLALRNHYESLEQLFETNFAEKAANNFLDESVAAEDIKIAKAKEEFDKANKNYEELSNQLKDSKIGTKIDENGFHSSRDAQDLSLEALSIDTQLKINKVKQEEIKLAQGKISEEYKKVLAPVERKLDQGRKNSRFSANMIGSTRAHNQYYSRVIASRRTDFERPLKLKGKSVKDYIKNENNLLDSARISQRVSRIMGNAIAKELVTYLAKATSIEDITELIKRIKAEKGTLNINEKNELINNIEKNPLIVDYNNRIDDLKSRLDDIRDQVDNPDSNLTEEEFDTLNEEDFSTENEIEKLEKDSPIKKLQFLINTIVTTDNSKLTNIKVQRTIANDYLIASSFITDDYKFNTEDGELVATPIKDIEDDINSIVDKIDTLEDENAELGRLKDIFQQRNDILSNKEFDGFIDSIDTQVNNNNAVLKVLNELKDSRSREDKQSLNNHITELIQQIASPSVLPLIESKVPKGIFNELQSNITITSESSIEDLWKARASIKGILEHFKDNEDNKDLTNKINSEKDSLLNTIKSELSNDFGGIMDIFNRDYKLSPVTTMLSTILNFSSYSTLHANSKHRDSKSALSQYKKHLDLQRLLNDLTNNPNDNTDYSQGSFSKEDLIQLIRNHIKFVNLDNLQNSIDTNRNQLQEVEDEITTLLDLKDQPVPSNQQLLTIRAFIDFFLRPIEKEVFRNWAYLKAPAGTGKSLIVGKWIPEVLGLSLKDEEVLAAGHNTSSSKNINSAIGLVGEPTIEGIINELNKIENDSVKLIILDEISGITEKQITEFNDILKEYIDRTGNDTRVLALGDPNQMVISGVNKLGFSPYIENSNGRKSFTTRITTLPALTIRYRSNISAINNFSDKFNNELTDITNKEIKVKSNGPLTKGAKGVINSNNFKNDIVSYLKLIDTKDKQTRTIITNPDRVVEYEQLLSSNSITGVQVIDYIGVQGQTINEVFVDLDQKDPLFKFDKKFDIELFNKAMYVATSRATDLLVTTGFSNIQNIVDPNLEKSATKNSDNLKSQLSEFSINRNIELQVLRDMTKSLNLTSNDRVDTKEEKTPEETPEMIVPTSKVDDILINITEDDEVEVDKDEKDFEEESKNSDEYSTTDEELDKLNQQIKGTPLDKIVRVINTTFDAMRDYANDNFIGPKTAAKFNLKVTSRAIQPGDKVLYVPTIIEGKKGKTNGILMLTEAKDPEGNVVEDKYRQVGYISGKSSKEISEMSKKKELMPIVDKFRDFFSTGLVNGEIPRTLSKNNKILDLKKVPLSLHEATIVTASGMKYNYETNPDGTFKGDDINVEKILETMVKFFNDGDISKLTDYRDNSYIKIFRHEELGIRDKALKEFSKFQFIDPGVPYLVVSGRQGDVTQLVRLSRKKLSKSNLHHIAFVRPILDLITDIKYIDNHINTSEAHLKSIGQDEVNKDIRDIARFNPKVGTTYESITSGYKYDITQEFLDKVNSLVDNSYSEPKRKLIQDDISSLRINQIVSVSRDIMDDPSFKDIQSPILTGRGKGELSESMIYEKGLKIVSINPDNLVVSYKSYQDKEDKLGTLNEVEIPFKYIMLRDKVRTGAAQGVLNALTRANKSLREKYKIEQEDLTEGIDTSDESKKKTNFAFPSILNTSNNPVTNNIVETLENILDFDNNGLNLRIPVPIYKKIVSKDGSQPTILMNFRNNTERDNPNSISNSSVLNTFLESNFTSITPTTMSVTFDELINDKNSKLVGYMVNKQEVSTPEINNTEIEEDCKGKSSGESININDGAFDF